MAGSARRSGRPVSLVSERGDGFFIYPDSFTSAFKRLALLAGLHPDTRLHDVRHAVATELGRQGVQPVIVSAVLGHSSPSFTIAVYQHAWQEGPAEAAAALEAAPLSGVGNPLAREGFGRARNPGMPRKVPGQRSGPNRVLREPLRICLVRGTASDSDVSTLVQSSAYAPEVSPDPSSRIPHAETRTPADSEEAMCCFCGGSVRMDDAVRIWLSRAGSETRQHLCAHQEHLEAAIAPSEIDLYF